MNIEVGDLVTISTHNDAGIVVRMLQQHISNFDLQNYMKDHNLRDEITFLAEVYWQTKQQAKLEILSDLEKIC